MIKNTFASAKASGSKTLIAYITAGYPDLATTVEVAVALAKAGVDLIELGVPFSDPVADGPVIQAAAGKALAGGTTVAGVLKVVEQISKRTAIPQVLMTYYNPVYQYGLTNFTRHLAAAGGSGIIVPDLPLEECDPLLAAADKNSLDLIPLVAPNTTPQRLTLMAPKARGFIYCVSVTGVTGARSHIDTDLAAMTARVRKYTSLPAAVGFGISGPEQIAAIAPHCDGIIVGSALVQTMMQHQDTTELINAVSQKAKQLKQALINTSLGVPQSAAL